MAYIARVAAPRAYLEALQTAAKEWQDNTSEAARRGVATHGLGRVLVGRVAGPRKPFTPGFGTVPEPVAASAMYRHIYSGDTAAMGEHALQIEGAKRRLRDGWYGIVVTYDSRDAMDQVHDRAHELLHGPSTETAHERRTEIAQLVGEGVLVRSLPQHAPVPISA